MLMKINEIQCKQALVKSNLPDSDYVINPYTGCGHKCSYCYARFMMRFRKGNAEQPDKWGDFVDVKINSPEALKKQLETAKKGTVILSSVTDCYQPIEKKYELTRKILEVLLKKQFPVSILTKSDLVLRDIDLIKQFKDISIGFTINTLDEEFKKKIEPGSSSVGQRLNALKILNENNINIYVMIGPTFPFFTDVPAIFVELNKEGVKSGYAERFNTNGSNWYDTKKVLQQYYPEKVNEFEDSVFNINDFNKNAEKQILLEAKRYGMKFQTYFNAEHLQQTGSS